MARIAVVHPKFDTKGGAEVVCFNTLEALQTDHEIRLFSFDDPDFDALNEFCGTAVEPVETWHPERLSGAFDVTMSALNRVFSDQIGNVNKVMTAVLNPLVRRRTAGFDLTVSTGGEMALPAPTLQYVHLPIFNGRFDPSYGTNGRLSAGHDWFCSRLAGATRETIGAAKLVTNSEWTADVVETRYGIRPEVVYPPVNVAEFYDVPWAERENGFVVLGRIAPDKAILKLIEIISRVRAIGHDVHLHVVGPTATASQDYRQHVEHAAAGRDWVVLEDEMSRRALVDLVCTHKYGIHGKRAEHFGIAVAELVAGGTIPFVPADGGQVALVGRQTELVYTSTTEAVAQIDTVLSDTEKQRDLRTSLPPMMEFGQDRFEQEITGYVDELLSATHDRRRRCPPRLFGEPHD